MGLYIYTYTTFLRRGGSSMERNETNNTRGAPFYTLLQRREWSKPIRRRDVGLSICLGFLKTSNARR